MASSVLIDIVNLHFGYDGENVLNGATISVLSGEIFVIVGQSGSGKSTLLKSSAGLFYPKDGRVEIKGIDVNKAPRDRIQRLRGQMGFVFQDAALISNMCVFDNVALPLRYHTEMSEAEIEGRVSEKLNLLQIERSYDYLLPDQLSLGLQRKVGVARALAVNPDVVFFDELTASFDSHTVHMLANVIRWLKNDLDVTSIIVSGDVSLAYSIADRIAVLKDGKVAETGTPDEIRDSRNPDVTLVTSMT